MPAAEPGAGRIPSPSAPEGPNTNRRGREPPYPAHSANPSPGGAARVSLDNAAEARKEVHH